jgi:hypothetical protein
MRSLPAAITTEIAKDAQFQALMFKLSLGSTYRWTDLDTAIRFANEWWQPKGIKVASFDRRIDSDVITTKLTIPNVTQWFSDICLAEDIRRKPIMIYQVWLDFNLSVLGCTLETQLPILFDGLIDSIPPGGANPLEVEVNIIDYEITGSVSTPRREHASSCPWAFAGPYCTYAGAETICDHSWARCIELANTDHFGGDEFISILADQQDYWGQRPKNWAKR